VKVFVTSSSHGALAAVCRAVFIAESSEAALVSNTRLVMAVVVTAARRLTAITNMAEEPITSSSPDPRLTLR
jgi:hypothetical protein